MSEDKTDDTALVPKQDQQQLVEIIASDEPEYERYLQRMTGKKRERVRNSVNRMRTGLHAVAPVMCMGPEKCLFVAFCPIPPRTETGSLIVDDEDEIDFGPLDDYPMYQQCVLERMYMKQKTIDYIQYLDVDPGNPVEISIVNELAVIDLLKNRCLMIMSVGDKDGQGRDFMRVDITGYSENGAASESTSLHPVADYIDKLEKRRERWLDRLIETRKSKTDISIKLGTRHEDSKVLKELQILRQALQGMAGATLALALEDDEEILIEEE